ncbi:MAG: hypothetical protein O2V44_08255 [Candidatus Bathyarchaeota archaeon]|nr:hypothetical protein [Candidatus Bathyarchaeota archaeon]
MEEDQVWHYILPFPLETEKRRLIWSVLQSKVGKSLLMNMKLEGRTYQRDIINGTSYSNKSIIKYLKRMVSADMLEQGMEQVATGKRKVRIKWYVPTKLGRWFILFLKPTEEISPELVRKTIEEILHVYASSIVEVCENFGINIDVFRNILNTEYSKKPTIET